MANFFPPSVVGIDQEVDLNRSISARTLFDYEDLDGNPLRKIRFFDANGNQQSGFFTVRGQQQNAGQWFEVSAADLRFVRYNAGLVVGNEVIQMQVYDGENWSTPDDARVYTVEPNLRPPDVETFDVTVLGNEMILGSTMFSATDFDGDAIVKYRVRDQKRNRNSGSFWLNNTMQQQGQWFEFSADELSNLRYLGGRNGQVERFFVRASDGEKWSSGEFGTARTIQNRFRPVVDAVDRNLKTNAVVNVGNLFSWSDRDGNTMKKFSFFDTGVLPDGGFFSVNGVRQQNREWFTVRASDVESGVVKYHASQVFDSERVRVKVHDGRFSSRVNTFRINTVIKPEVEVIDFAEVVLDSSPVDLTQWFTQTDSGPTVTKWQFFDNSTAKDNFGNELTGSLVYDGDVLEAQRVREFTTAELADLNFTSGLADRGIEYDEIFVRGKNGDDGYWSDWQRVNIHSLFNMPEALVNPERKWGAAVHGTGFTMTYSFMEVLPLYYVGLDEDNGTFQPFTVAMRQATREVLRHYERTFNIDFVEVSDVVGGEMRFGMVDNVDAIAYAYLPPLFGTPTNNGWPPADVWAELDFVYDEFTDANGNVFPEFGWFDDNAMVKGNDLYLALIHEVGHSLGLRHTFDEGPGTDILRPQVDSNNFTVMSYTRAESSNPVYPFTDGAASTQLYDNVALDYLYGHNTEYNKEDTVYRWMPNEHEDYAETIHDPGGIDTLNFSNYTPSATIDLREGRHSSVANESRNFNISYGTIIENVIAGSGHDTITGNEVDNRIVGGRGHDTMAGMGGRDVLIGNEGHDTYLYTLGDGQLIIDEQKGAGRDVIEMSSFHDDFDSFKQDLRFRRVNDRDLQISLTLDGGESEGSITIKNMKWGGSRVETLKLYDNKGDQVGQDMSLRSIFLQASNQLQRFERTEFKDAFGFLAIPS